MKLHQRGANYHLRLRVPSDLVSVIGRHEIHQSLRTTDGRTARSRADQLKASIQSGFEKLRMARLTATHDDEMIGLANGLLSSLGSTRRNRGVVTNSVRPMRLRELMDQHLAEKRLSLDPRSFDKMSYSYRLAVHHIGNVLMRDLNRMVCRNYRDVLRQSPQFLLREDAASKNLDRVLSDKSVNLHLQYLSGLMRWATLEELINGNPAEGLIIKKQKRESEERFAFSDDQLQRLLGKLWKDETRSVRRWVPLIALWTGMRQEEICQLRHCDVIERDDIHCFVITREAGSVKSSSAERIVPIHPWLINKGFLIEVWRPDKEMTNERLWPELRKTKLGRYSNALCKWFGRYKRKQGFMDSRYCFHSLRHTFINAMKQSEVPEPVIRQLVGHQENSITMGRYGKSYDLDKLSHYVNTLSFNLQLEESS
jgi:integrase